MTLIVQVCLLVAAIVLGIVVITGKGHGGRLTMPETWAERAVIAGEVLDAHERDCNRCLLGSCPLKDSLEWWYKHCCEKGGL